MAQPIAWLGPDYERTRTTNRNRNYRPAGRHHPPLQTAGGGASRRRHRPVGSMGEGSAAAPAAGRAARHRRGPRAAQAGGVARMSRWCTYHLAEPPRPLRSRGVRLDNVALMPASALPDKEQWREIANRLPAGDVLILLPAADKPQRKTLTTVAGLLRGKGHRVTTIAAERFG